MEQERHHRRVTKTPWYDQAACRGTPTNDFFPEYETKLGHRGSRPTPEIQALCDSCPVRVPCLTTAIRNNEVGVWGGTTQSQRASILRAVPRVKCPRCRAALVLTFRRVGVCLACGLSWRDPGKNPATPSHRSKRPTNGAGFLQ